MSLIGYRTEENLGSIRLGERLLAAREADDTPVWLTLYEGARSEASAEVLAESQALAQANTYHILPVLDVGTAEDGRPYLVTPTPAGESLRALLTSRGGLRLEVLCSLAVQVTRSLVAAHELGISHGDISAQCIYLSAGSDGGLVQVDRYGGRHLFAAYRRDTKDDRFWGTPEYLAPELCSGKPVDLRADLYSLGIVLYEAITAKPPFVSNSYKTTIKRQIYEKPLPLHLVKPGMPHIREFESIVTRAVQKAADQRYQTAGELLDDLMAFQAAHYPELEIPADPGAGAAPIEAVEASPPPEPTAEVDGTIEEVRPEDVADARHSTLVFGGLRAPSQVQMSPVNVEVSVPDANEETGPAAPDELAAADDWFDAPEQAAVEETSKVSSSAVEAGDEWDSAVPIPEVSHEEEQSSGAPERVLEVIDGGATDDSPDDESGTPDQGMGDWFVDGADNLSESDDFDGTSKDRKTWFIVAAACVLVGLFFLVIDSSQPDPDADTDAAGPVAVAPSSAEGQAVPSAEVTETVPVPAEPERASSEDQPIEPPAASLEDEVTRAQLESAFGGSPSAPVEPVEQPAVIAAEEPSSAVVAGDEGSAEAVSAESEAGAAPVGEEGAAAEPVVESADVGEEAVPEEVVPVVAAPVPSEPEMAVLPETVTAPTIEPIAAEAPEPVVAAPVPAVAEEPAAVDSTPEVAEEAAPAPTPRAEPQRPQLTREERERLREERAARRAERQRLREERTRERREERERQRAERERQRAERAAARQKAATPAAQPAETAATPARTPAPQKQKDSAEESSQPSYARMIRLGHQAMRRDNYRLALLYYNRAKEQGASGSIQGFITRAQRKLDASASP